ncbi:MAG: YjjG family noncanonical pyrimidine nucleotidase [Streptococcaceae bacterium]|jgi:2-haloacid dehalogenase|nr:YjjG family noncanonical pyrimidine nucleotidase [Streptococcaceae bacterium]
MKTILFDLDNTLLDFSKAEAEALKQVYEKYEIPLTEETIEVYENINAKLWEANEAGLLSRSELFSQRFTTVFTQLGKPIESGRMIDDEYRRLLSESAHLIEGAGELLTELKTAGHPLYIVTNGTPKVSRPRIEKSGIASFFKDVFVSEEIGTNKPSKAFFDYVFEHIPESSNDAVIVGDSLSSDIKGGIDAGIQTIWFNPLSIQNDSGIVPDYEIKNLKEILAYI